MSAYGGAGPRMLGVIWTLALIGTPMTILRGWAAGITQDGKPRWDFVYALVAAVFGLVTTVILTFECIYGIGNHVADVPLMFLPKALHMVWTGIATALVALTASKLAIVALLLHITAHKIQPRRRALLWTIALITVAINFVQMVLSLTQCTPFEHLWQRFDPGSCPRAKLANNYGYLQGSWSIFADFFLALYPASIAWTLQVSLKTKLCFCALMAVGIIPALAAIMRIIYLQRLIALEDITYSLYPFATWGMVEVWSVIIIGNIPPLRPFFLRVVLGRKAAPSTGATIEAPSSRRRAGTDDSWDDDECLVTELSVVEKGKA